MVQRYYPIFLDLSGRRVIVIGGGEVALRKVEGLLEASADVTVVSPGLHPELQALADSGSVTYVARPYQAGDLQGYFLAFVGTDDGHINAVVAEEGKRSGVLVNAVDDPANCDFVMPAIVRRGRLAVAISTGGGSPAAARRIREEIEAFLTDDYELLLDLATEVRRELRAGDITIDSEVWNRALDNELRALLANGQRGAARERLLAALKQAER